MARQLAASIRYASPSPSTAIRIPPIADRSPEQRRDDHRPELERAEQADERGGMGEQEDLRGERDERDLAAGARHELACHQQPEVAGLPERRDVEGDPPRAADGRATFGRVARGVSLVVDEESFARRAAEPA
jgi:hypothetical protein